MSAHVSFHRISFAISWFSHAVICILIHNIVVIVIVVAIVIVVVVIVVVIILFAFDILHERILLGTHSLLQLLGISTFILDNIIA